ncbi:hypothetical protein ANO11243_073940 [Dothideomycetidae sp. 11243]|nr:hypothetical protein ANO11243_073940 [fungal sp. No.11243]
MLLTLKSEMHVLPRQQSTPGGGTSSKTIVIVLVVVITALIASILACLWYFNRRAKRRKQQQGVRKSWRQSIQSFTSTFSRPPPVRSDVRDSSGSHAMEDVETSAGVDRNTSVRSVMTLPAYSAVPSDNEGVLGREGERAGMDTVVEFPETNVEEEERREAEMESLYQIRLARRREAEEREQRRQRRREARARGDETALATLRQESRRARQNREQSGSRILISEHESTPRSRRVSSVSYGNLGVARHDGSRVRANSEESHQPLLDMAGEIDISEPPRPWLSHETSSSHRRGRSSATNSSMHSYGSDEDSGWEPSRNTGLNINTNVQGEGPTPPYVDPPPYTSPVDVRQSYGDSALPQTSSLTARPVSDSPSLPAIERLPSIRVTAETPIATSPPHKQSFAGPDGRRDSRVVNTSGLE